MGFEGLIMSDFFCPILGIPLSSSVKPAVTLGSSIKTPGFCHFTFWPWKRAR